MKITPFRPLAVETLPRDGSAPGYYYPVNRNGRVQVLFHCIGRDQVELDFVSSERIAQDIARSLNRVAGAFRFLSPDAIEAGQAFGEIVKWGMGS